MLVYFATRFCSCFEEMSLAACIGVYFPGEKIKIKNPGTLSEDPKLLGQGEKHRGLQSWERVVLSKSKVTPTPAFASK